MFRSNFVFKKFIRRQVYDVFTEAVDLLRRNLISTLFVKLS